MGEHHPLQAFSRRYFQKDALSDGLFSTRQDYADALNQPQAEAQPFFLEALSQEEPGKAFIRESSSVFGATCQSLAEEKLKLGSAVSGRRMGICRTV